MAYNPVSALIEHNISWGVDSPPINCTPSCDIQITDFYFVINIVIACVGGISSCFCLLCLYFCPAVSFPAKIPLFIFFSSQISICFFSLPGFSYIKRMTILCRASKIPMEIKLTFLFFHTILLPIERANFAVMAITRLLAIGSSNGYRKFMRTKAILGLEILILLCVISPWIIAFSINLHNVYPIEEQMSVSFSSGKSFTIWLIYFFHGMFHLFPTLLALIAFVLTVGIILRRKLTMQTSLRSSSVIEQVASTIRLLICVNLVLDMPHVFAHLMQISQAPSLIVHSIFYSHLAFDPLIFLYNRNNRSFLYEYFLGSCLFQCISRLHKRRLPNDSSNQIDLIDK